MGTVVHSMVYTNTLEVKHMTKTKEALRRLEEKFDKLSPADKDRVVAYAEGAAAVRESLKRKKK